MRTAAVLVLLLLAAAPARAQVQFDTVSTRIVGPGMTHWQIEAPLVPWTLDVLELDLTNPYLQLETVEAYDRQAGGFETVSEMAARKDAPGRRVVGAVNGDYFGGGGATNSASISNGEIVRRERPNYPSIGVTEDLKAFLSRPTIGGSVATQSGTYAITGYNEARQADGLVLFNPFFGTATGTNAFGTEVRIRPLSPWHTNDTLLVVAEAIENNTGNMAIPAGKAVLSGHGAAIPFLQAIQVGDTLQVLQEVMPGPERITQLISGNPYLMVNGVPDPLDGSAFNNDRHPRTVLGFSADTTRFYLITVDGRQASSAGMSNFEMRDFLIRVGIPNAINVDGGGSTTMVVRGEVVNSVIERSVGNGFMAFSTAPEDGPLSVIQTMPDRKRLFLGRPLQLSVTAANAFYHPAALDSAQLSFSVAPELGTVSPEGLFTAGFQPDTGYVYVSYGSLRDSVQVIIKGLSRLAIAPHFAVTDTARTVRFTTRSFDSDGMEQSAPAGLLTWSSSDTTVGVVDDAGLFRGKQEGTTQVRVQFAPGIADSATVRVEVGQGVQVLDPLDALGGWHLSLGNGHDTSATQLTVFEDPAATGARSFHVRYHFTASAALTGPLTLRTDLPIYGVPDSVNFTLRSDGAQHRAFLDFQDYAGRLFSVSVPRYADDSTRYAFMPGPLSRANYPLASIVYPIRLTGIRLELGYKGGRVSGKTYEGDLFLDDLRVTYPQRTSVAVEELPKMPEVGFALLGSQPNPFRGTTSIAYRAEQAEAVRLVLYDVLGRAVATVFDGRVVPGDHTLTLDAEQLPSGVYFLRRADAAGLALKLVVLR